MEKSTGFNGTERVEPTPRARSKGKLIAALVILPLCCLLYLWPYASSGGIPNPHGDNKVRCVQPPALMPKSDTPELKKAYEFLSSETFRNDTIERMSKAVQIATESFDDMGAIGEGKRWDIMYDFADYLEKIFPQVHEKLKLEKVNTHGLVYTWTGSDEGAKPTLFMAHQDVVPVPDTTVDAWTHPPFSGFYDGKSIWGRGASDCKNQLIAAMESLEQLLNAGFQPRRTIILSLGFDEEISGTQGGAYLAPFLLDRYGKDGIAAIVDEGASFESVWGSTLAKPGVGEKGYTDVYFTVRMPGGHSSMPTDRTSIGVAGEIVAALESEQYPIELTSENPYLGQLYCGAEHSPAFPKKLKKLLSKASKCASPAGKKYAQLAQEAAKAGRATKYLMQTSQAVDVITGGVKVNALPERTIVTINHRVNIGSEPKAVWDRITAVARPIAKKHGLELHAFDGTKEAPESISLFTSNTTLNVAPVTPTDADSITPWTVLSGTIRAVYGEQIVVVPGLTTANSDTRYYWDLTKHIFRFMAGFDPKDDVGLGNIHTVDERISVVNHINAVKWFTLFVRNMDEAKL